jgi:hypothetical protein
MASLVVGLFLLAWDWGWFAFGFHDQYFLGITHLVIDVWWILLVAAGLKRALGVPTWQGLLLSFLMPAAAFPPAVIVMRSAF